MEKPKLLKEVYKPKESDIAKSIQRYLDCKGIFNFQTHAGQIIPVMTGISDIIGALPDGKILAIEVKRPGWESPKENSKQYNHYLKQFNFLQNIRRSKGIAFFARSIEEVETGLNDAGY